MLEIGTRVKAPSGDLGTIVDYQAKRDMFAEGYFVKFDDGWKLFMREGTLTPVTNNQNTTKTPYSGNPNTAQKQQEKPITTKPKANEYHIKPSGIYLDLYKGEEWIRNYDNDMKYMEEIIEEIEKITHKKYNDIKKDKDISDYYGYRWRDKGFGSAYYDHWTKETKDYKEIEYSNTDFNIWDVEKENGKKEKKVETKVENKPQGWVIKDDTQGQASIWDMIETEKPEEPKFPKTKKSNFVANDTIKCNTCGLDLPISMFYIQKVKGKEYINKCCKNCTSKKMGNKYKNKTQMEV